MMIKQSFAVAACTAAVLLVVTPAHAMGIVDASAASTAGAAAAAAPAPRQTATPAVAAANAESAADSIPLHDGELALVAIAAMALAARGIASRMR